MTTLLVNFTESEKQGRRFIYTDYKDVVVYKEKENDKTVFVKEVNHRKNLSSLNIRIELDGKRTKEELLKAIKRKAQKYEREQKSKETMIKNDFKKALNITKLSKKYEQLLSIYERIYNEENHNGIINILSSFKKINKSPYSSSFYDSDDIGWDSKPEGSLRLSDHWNFYSLGEQHCCLDSTKEYTRKWLLCQYHNGVYHVVKEL